MNKHAQALGRLSKGVPRTFTAEQLAAATARLAASRYRGGRKPGATNLATRAFFAAKKHRAIADKCDALADDLKNA
jgi:hypothetical protein